MKVTVRIILVLLLLIGGVAFLSHSKTLFAAAASIPVTIPLTSLQAGAIAAASSTAPSFDVSGVVVVDGSQGGPGAPYIAYLTPKGAYAVKELVFDSYRGCQISAAEADCVRQIDEQLHAGDVTYPVHAGESITLHGYQVDQTIHVKSYSDTASVPAGMAVFSVTQGTTATLSNGLSLTPTDQRSGASCTFGSGCYGNGVVRELVTLSTGKSSTIKEMVPGATFSFGKSAISVLTIDHVSDTPVITFLVSLTK